MLALRENTPRHGRAVEPAAGERWGGEIGESRSVQRCIGEVRSLHGCDEAALLEVDVTEIEVCAGLADDKHRKARAADGQCLPRPHGPIDEYDGPETRALHILIEAKTERQVAR